MVKSIISSRTLFCTRKRYFTIVCKPIFYRNWLWHDTYKSIYPRDWVWNNDWIRIEHNLTTSIWACNSNYSINTNLYTKRGPWDSGQWGLHQHNFWTWCQKCYSWPRWQERRKADNKRNTISSEGDFPSYITTYRC